MTRPPVVELGPLGLDGGGHVPLRIALGSVRVGEEVAVRGTHPELAGHLRAWCRSHGHVVRTGDPAGPDAPDHVVAVVARGRAEPARWSGPTIPCSARQASFKQKRTDCGKTGFNSRNSTTRAGSTRSE